MADQKRWFKVWASLLVDMDNLPDDLIGKWTRLGCRTAVVGNSGTVVFDSWTHLAGFLKVPVSSARSTLERLPSVSFEEGEKCNGKLAVTFRKWHFYQEDRTSAERVRSLRSKRRREEKREEENLPPDPPPRALTATRDEPPALQPVDPPPPMGPPECEICARILNHLNERTARTYNAPGRTGLWLHSRHVQYGESACLRVIDLKVSECQRDPKGWKFIGPNVLFKPENFDVYCNQSRPVSIESEDERRFLASLSRRQGGDA